MIPVLIPDTFDLQRLYDSAGKALFDSAGKALYVLNPAPTIPADNGLGELADAESCVVETKVNGPGELTMVYPITGSLFADLKPRCVIMARPGRTGNAQPYRIYRITKPMSGRVTVYARHFAYDGLSGVPVSPFTANGIQAAMAAMKANAMVNCPFTLTTTRTTGSTFTVPVPTDIWSLLGGQQGSLLDVYGGEYSFDGYTVRLENRIGQDNGVKVRYGVNMVDLEQDTNVASCYTGVVTYWRGEDEEVHSPVLHTGGAYNYVRILPVDMSDRWEEKPTVAQLTAAGQSYITANQIGVPTVRWKVEMVDLADTEEYKDLALLEQVNLGDTVGVEFEALGVDASARVCADKWDVLRERHITITLGSVKSNIASTIAGQARELKQTVTRAEAKSLAEQISDTLTRAILGADGGTIRFLDTNNDGEEDTLYVADNPDPAQAVKVWRWNYEGWAASENGYNGPFVLGATVGGGLLANFVTAANLVAGTIQSADGETFVLDLDNGTMQIGGNGIITSPDGSFVINLSTGVLYTTAEVTYDASDYSQSDVTRIAQIIAGSVTPTSTDYEKYDFYQDGEITGADLTMCQNMVNTGNDLTIAWSAKVQPNERGKTFSLEMNGNTVFRAGVNQIETHDGKFANKVDASVVEATTQIVVQESGNTNMILLNASTGRIDCNSLYINGQPVTP